MPISIDYAPSAASVGYSANIAGLGDYQRWLAQQALAQNSQALQAASLAQQGQFHQDQLASHLYGQNLGYLGDMQRLQAANQQRMQGQQFDAAKTVYENQQQGERQQNLFDQQDAHQQQTIALQRDQLDLQATQTERQWAEGIGQSIKNASSSGFKVDDMALGKAWGDYQKVMGAKNLSEREKWISAGDARREIERVVNNAAPGPPPPTNDELYSQGTVEKALPNGDVEIWRRTPARNGGAPGIDYSHTRRADGQDEKAAATKQVREDATIAGMIAKGKMEGEGEAKTVRPYTAEELADARIRFRESESIANDPTKLAAGRERQQQEQAIDQEAKSQYDNYQAIAASVKEKYNHAKDKQPYIAEHLKQRYGLDEHGNMKQFKLADFKANVRQQAAQQQMAQQQASPDQSHGPPPLAQAQSAAEMPGQPQVIPSPGMEMGAPQGQHGRQSPPQQSQQPPADQRVAPAASGTRLAEQPQAVATTPAATPKKMVTINGMNVPEGTPKKHVEAMKSLLPHPPTPEDAMKLPPGTTFVKPDGSLGVVPQVAR